MRQMPKKRSSLAVVRSRLLHCEDPYSQGRATHAPELVRNEWARIQRIHHVVVDFQVGCDSRTFGSVAATESHSVSCRSRQGSVSCGSALHMSDPEENRPSLVKRDLFPTQCP